MSHIQRTVGKALAAALSRYEFPLPQPRIAVTYNRVPDYDVNALGKMEVTVTPGPVEVKTEIMGRGANMFSCTLGILVAARVYGEDDVEKLEDVNQAIIDAIRSERMQLDGVPANTDWTEIQYPAPFDREALNSRNVFLSQIEIVYQVPVDKV